MGVDPDADVVDALLDRVERVLQRVDRVGGLAEDRRQEIGAQARNSRLGVLDRVLDALAGLGREPAGMLLDGVHELGDADLAVFDRLGDLLGAHVVGVFQPRLDRQILQPVDQILLIDVALVDDLLEGDADVGHVLLGEARRVGHRGQVALDVGDARGDARHRDVHGLVELERRVENHLVDRLHHLADVEGLLTQLPHALVERLQPDVGGVEGLVALEALEQGVARRGDHASGGRGESHAQRASGRRARLARHALVARHRCGEAADDGQRARQLRAEPATEPAGGPLTVGGESAGGPRCVVADRAIDGQARIERGAKFLARLHAGLGELRYELVGALAAGALVEAGEDVGVDGDGDSPPHWFQVEWSDPGSLLCALRSRYCLSRSRFRDADRNSCASYSSAWASGACTARSTASSLAVWASICCHSTRSP